MTTIHMIRHGESEANSKGFFAGQFDVPLMPNGIEQAAKTASFVAEKYAPDCIYSSDLIRAYQTAEPLSRLIGVDIKTHKGLREIYAGLWQQKTFNQLQTEFADEYNLWLNDIGNSRCSGGESIEELGRRVMATLTSIAEQNPGKTVAIATHATPIRVAQTIIQYGDIKCMKDVPWVSNSSVTTFEYDGNWKCIRVSEDEHLGEFKTVFPPNV